MTRQTALLGFIFGFLCFALGYFVGREHLRNQLQQQIQTAAGQAFFPKYSKLLDANPGRNQASAVASFFNIKGAEVSYSSSFKTGFSRDLLSLGGDSTSATANAAGLIDSELASGTKNGYRFTYVAGPVISGTTGTYSVRADPVEPGVSGFHYYYADQTGVIRFNEREQAGPKDPPLPD